MFLATRIRRASVFFVFLTVSICIHELGHFTAAKEGGVAVVEFSVGFGPRLLRIRDSETAYTLRLVPIGGANYLLDQKVVASISDDERVELALNNPAHFKLLSDESRWFDRQALTRRALIIFAGPLASFVAGALFLIVGFALRKGESEGKSILGHIGELIMTFVDLGWDLVKIVCGKAPIDSMMGPLGIYKVGVDNWKSGPSYFMEFLGAVTIAFGFFNLLPLWPLDGYHLALMGYEGIVGAPTKSLELSARLVTGFVFGAGIGGIVAVKLATANRSGKSK